MRRKVDEEAVTALEGVKFGTVARGMSAEVGYLAVVAEGMAEKLRWVDLPFTSPRTYLRPGGLDIRTKSTPSIPPHTFPLQPFSP